MISSSVILILLVSTLANHVVQAYPLIAQVSEQSKRCFKFNIPEDDDAHMIFLALPMEEDTADTKEGKLEGWLVQEMYEMTNKRQGENLPFSFVKQAPADIQGQMDTFIQQRGDNFSKLKVVVSMDSNSPTSRVLPLKYFAPTVINKIKITLRFIFLDTTFVKLI